MSTQDNPHNLGQIRDSIKAGVSVCLALADAIRELGKVPNGVLYANVAPVLALRDYIKAIDVLLLTGLIAEEANVLIWKGDE